jgi:hypothetical protein
MLYVSIAALTVLGIAVVGVMVQRSLIARRHRKPTQTELDIERAEGEGMVSVRE